MADLAPTLSDVKAASGASKKDITAGGTADRFAPVFKATDGDYEPASAAAAATAEVEGLMLSDAADGQPSKIITDGELEVGAILTVGEVYVLSATSGKVAPIGDLVSTNVVKVIGVAKTTSILVVQINPASPVKP